MKREAERWYTVEEAAEQIGVKPGFIRERMRATEGNTLDAKNISKSAKQPRYRISASALNAFMGRMDDA